MTDEFVPQFAPRIKPPSWNSPTFAFRVESLKEAHRELHDTLYMQLREMTNSYLQLIQDKPDLEHYASSNGNNLATGVDVPMLTLNVALAVPAVVCAVLRVNAWRDGWLLTVAYVPSNTKKHEDDHFAPYLVSEDPDPLTVFHLRPYLPSDALVRDHYASLTR